MRTLLVVILRWALLAAPIVHAEAATLQVNNINPVCDDTAGTPFCSISAAINSAFPGDAILVADSVYLETLRILTDDLTLVGQGLPTIDGANSFVGPLEGVVNINAIGISFVGFEVRGSSQIGIRANPLSTGSLIGASPLSTGSCAQANISENWVHNNRTRGIEVGKRTLGCENVLISRNRVWSNGHGGISISGGGGNIVSRNRAVKNGGAGFNVILSRGNKLFRNVARSNGGNGFSIEASGGDGFNIVDGDRLNRNIAIRNGKSGFYVGRGSVDTLLTRNRATRNRFFGFQQSQAFFSRYRKNICRKNRLGPSSPPGLCRRR